MFTLDQTIDTVQNGKKQFVKTFVQNEAVANALNNFVDAQSEYTKKAAKVGVDTFTTLTSEATKAAQNAMKFDYAKFGEGIMKAYANLQK
jgi:ABC-type transporter Mla subunit MlaD